MAKETITRAEYFQLQGLGLIARRHYAQIIEARDAMHSILGTSEDAPTGSADGWVGDAIWDGDTNIDYMLKAMGVTVEPEAVNADS
jgi:hypothetical protein